jgi:hypothetical protein
MGPGSAPASPAYPGRHRLFVEQIGSSRIGKCRIKWVAITPINTIHDPRRKTDSSCPFNPITPVQSYLQNFFFLFFRNHAMPPPSRLA